MSARAYRRIDAEGAVTFSVEGLSRGEAECLMGALADANGDSHRGEGPLECPWCRMYLEVRDALRAAPSILAP